MGEEGLVLLLGGGERDDAGKLSRNALGVPAMLFRFYCVGCSGYVDGGFCSGFGLNTL